MPGITRTLFCSLSYVDSIDGVVIIACRIVWIILLPGMVLCFRPQSVAQQMVPVLLLMFVQDLHEIVKAMPKKQKPTFASLAQLPSKL